MTVATGFMIATVYIRKKKKGGTYYSIHSWTGLVISGLFGVEWLLGLGLIEKLLPNVPFGISRLSAPFLAKLKRIHVDLGKFFVLAIALVCIIGIEHVLMKDESGYKKLEPYYLSANAWGIGKTKLTFLY